MRCAGPGAEGGQFLFVTPGASFFSAPSFRCSPNALLSPHDGHPVIARAAGVSLAFFFFFFFFQWRTWVCESRILRIPHENIFDLNSGVSPCLFHPRSSRLFLLVLIFGVFFFFLFY